MSVRCDCMRNLPPDRFHRRDCPSYRPDAYTVGPWRVSACRDGGFRVVQAIAPVAQITKIGNKANAHLIAAAPALLKELEGILDALEKHGFVAASRVDEARATIAEAVRP